MAEEVSKIEILQADIALADLILRRQWAAITAESLGPARGVWLTNYESEVLTVLDLAVHIGAPDDVIKILQARGFPGINKVTATLIEQKIDPQVTERGYKALEAALNDDLESLVAACDEEADLTVAINVDGLKVDAMYFAAMHKNVKMIRYLAEAEVPLSKAAEAVLGSTKPRVRE